jgi:hypothetical protein
LTVTPVTGQPRAYPLQSAVEGGTDGKYIWSRWAFEERTEKGAAGSRTLLRGTSGFGKLKLEPAAHIVCVGSQTHQPCAKGEMEKGSKGIAASGGENCFGSCEAHHVGIRPQEDRGGTAGTVGEGEGGSEEGGVGPNRFTFS